MKVIVSADGLTPDDYIRSGCDAALSACPRRWKSDYEVALAGRIEVAEAAGDERAARAARVLHAVMATREPWNTAPLPAEDDPYWPTFEFDESSASYLSRLLDLDGAGTPVISDDEARARAADVLYQRSIAAGGKRDFRAATRAVESYLAEARRREAAENGWSHAEDRVTRAFDIAAELKNPDLKRTVAGHIGVALAAFSAPSGGLPSRYPLQLMRLLLRHFRKGDDVGHAALAERLAGDALTVNNWELARDYLGVAAEWLILEGAKAVAVGVQERAAELWVSEGEAMVMRPDTHAYHFAVAEMRLLRGIQALRAVRGAAKAQGMLTEEVRLDERVHEVRWLRQQYQERAVEAMIPFRESGKIDAAQVFAVVEGKDKLGALFAMTQFSLPTRADVEAMVLEEREKFMMSRYFGLTQLDERGRTTARADADDLLARACQRAVMLYELRAQCHVGPLLWKIDMNHAVDLADFEFIARASPFVPIGREPMYARGLYEGFKGDFSLALHLLIPQVENSVRLILRSVAATDDRLRAGCADVLTDPEQPFLTQSLYDPWASELARILGDGGEDVVFALRVLLLERFGGNLRNCVLHGLTPYGGTQGWRCWYLWWLILKVCCSTAIAAAQERSANGGEQDE